MTTRQRLKNVEKHGIRDPLLDSEPEMPDVGLHLWAWFWELDSGRQSGMGHNPLTWQDIRDWSDLTGTEITTWEVSIIKAMDRAYLKTAAELGRETK